MQGRRAMRPLRHDAERRSRRPVRLAFYALVGAALTLALVLGSGSATNTARAATAVGPTCNNDNYWCITLSINGSGSITLHDCQPIIGRAAAPEAAAAASCPGGTTERSGYPVTCPSTCSSLGTSDVDTIVIEATPSTNWNFSSWSGAPGCSTENPCTFAMPDQNLSITGNFTQQQYTLTVNANPAGTGSISDNLGKISGCTGTCSANYAGGTSVTLTATPASGYRLSSWSGCDSVSGNTCTVTMNSSRSVTANFVRSTYTLNVNVNPAGAGSASGCTTSCNTSYNSGSTVTVTANPFAGYHFTGWTGDCTSISGNSCTVTMDRDRSVTANFAPDTGTTTTTTTTTTSTTTTTTSSTTTGGATTGGTTSPHFRLTVGVVGRGRVQAAGIDCATQTLFSAQAGCQGDYLAGVTVTLVAFSGNGYTFQSWGGACAAFGALTTCRVTMDNNKAVNATFSANPVIGDEPPCSIVPDGTPCEQEEAPQPEKGLAVSISGADGGRVTGGPGGAQAFAASRTSSGSISCGGDSYVCYDTYSPGQTVTLKAAPASGFSFAGWSGACTTKAAKCTIRVNGARKVKASFTATGKRVRSMTMQPPKLRVRWNQSTGRGKLTVTGRVAGSARLTLVLRRPSAGPLLTLRKTVSRSGSFRFVKNLPSKFPNGARLFPGGKVVSLRGSASGFYVPTQIQSLPLQGPREGVVRQSYQSAAKAGAKKVPLPASATVGWANFRFEQQPAAGSRLWVDWYWPRGQGLRLGSVPKANRPIVSSFIRSGKPIPKGCWRTVLRVGGTKDGGGKPVKTQYVKIGTSHC